MDIPVYVALSNNLRGLATLAGFDQDPVGHNSKHEPVKLGFKLTTLAALFAESSNKDAHLVTYVIRDAEGNLLDRIPRLTKIGVDPVRAAGYTVEHIWVLMDLDLKDLVGRPGTESPPKLKWKELTDTEQNLVWKKVEDARIRLKDKGMEWALSYTTSGGFRFGHLLSIAVPAGPQYEALVGRFITAYSLVGLPVDEACKDWTRLFRCPRVTLESGLQTWEAEWFVSSPDSFEEFDDEAFYVPKAADLRPADVAPDVQIERTATRATPDPIEAQALVEFFDDESKKVKMTTPAKAAKRALADSGVFPWIYEKMPLAYPGKRHEMLTKAIGEVVGTLHGLPNITPEFIFGLLYEPVGRLGEDEDWTGKLWEMTTSYWDKDELKKAQKAVLVAEAVAEHEKVTESKLARFLRGVRTWCVEINGMNDEDAIEWLRQSRLGVLQDSQREKFHVLMDTGYYDEHPCSPTTLTRIIEQRGMQWLVPTEYSGTDKKGNTTVTKVPIHALLEQSVTVYSSEEIRLDKRGSYMLHDYEGREVFIEVPFYLRDDVEPKFHQEIWDLWFAASGGNEDMCNAMLAAMASLLLFQHGPTAAVFLWGHGNTGKSLAANSLAECLSTRRLADGASLVDNFNDTIRVSPIVHVDESLDRGNKGIDASASLRRLITATNTTVEKKGKDKVWMQGVHRVLMTANSKDIITTMLGGKVRSDSDLRAIAERIAIFHMHKAAAEWLTKHNHGWRITRDWIGRGRTGKYAQFWFWCIQNLIEWEGGKPKMAGRRLLYEGNAHSEVIEEAEANTGPVPEIVKGLNLLLDGGQKPRVAIESGRLWYQREPLIELVADKSGLDRGRITQALEALELEVPQPLGRTYVKGVQARWKALDARKILRLIEAHVTPNKAFDQLL